MAKCGFPWLMALLLSGLLWSGAVRAQDSSDNDLTLELFQRIEQLEAEVRQIRGELELQRYRIEALAQEQAMPESSAYPPGTATPPPVTPPMVPSPPAEARGQPAPAQPTAATPPPTPAQPTAATPPPTPASTERAEFDTALGELREGRYPEAIAAWRRFLQEHPNSGLAGDAQYWLGEAYYLSRDYNAAKEAFIALGLHQPQSGRLPDALLKLGYLYGEQGDTTRAREVLQKLVQVYPNTQAANLAERRLQSLR